MKADRLHNIFGALALAAVDRIRRGAEREIAHGGETAAALNLIGHVPALSIELLAQGLGLSHPGTVRLVDRLAAAGLVERKPSSLDRRSVELHITAAGVRARRTVLGERRSGIEALLAPLTALERKQLDTIAMKLLRGHVVSVPGALATCRFCNERACTDCPVNDALEASA